MLNDGDIVDVDSPEFSRAPIRPPDDPGEIKKHAHFFITINTNYKPKNQCETETMATQLRDTLRDNLLTGEGLKKVVEFKGPGEWSSRWITKVDPPRVKIEIGTHPKGSRLHAHVILDIEHRVEEGIWLNRDKIVDVLKECWPDSRVKGWYVNIKGSNPAARYQKDYLEKLNITQKSKASSELSCIKPRNAQNPKSECRKKAV